MQAGVFKTAILKSGNDHISQDSPRYRHITKPVAHQPGTSAASGRTGLRRTVKGHLDKAAILLLGRDVILRPYGLAVLEHRNRVYGGCADDTARDAALLLVGFPFGRPRGFFLLQAGWQLPVCRCPGKADGHNDPLPRGGIGGSVTKGREDRIAPLFPCHDRCEAAALDVQVGGDGSVSGMPHVVVGAGHKSHLLSIFQVSLPKPAERSPFGHDFDQPLHVRISDAPIPRRVGMGDNQHILRSVLASQSAVQVSEMRHPVQAYPAAALWRSEIHVMVSPAIRHLRPFVPE